MSHVKDQASASLALLVSIVLKDLLSHWNALLDIIAQVNLQSQTNVLLESMVILQNFNRVTSVQFVLQENIAKMELFQEIVL